ncbi:GIY-YIG nuclease family protein [Actinobacillus equuli subsp. haemolyticus]|nr:GIY-YIG nuclease family protein [Actinobacillus equuli subsp. haemolyticus]
MQIKLEWYEPIVLGSSGTLRERLKSFDFSDIPEVVGIYIFYRQTRVGGQEALYVGQSRNIRMRFRQHCNNLNLVEGLENSSQGTKVFYFAEVKVRNKNDLGYALNQAEKGYIQYLFNVGHPLLNRKLLSEKFDTIISTGNNVLELVSDELDVFSK